MIAIKVKKLKGIIEKSIGLIGKDTIEPVFFTTRWGIHTFGVTEPIDVVILDSQNTVIALRKFLQTNRFFFWNPKYTQVLELKAGFIEEKNIKIGSKITVI